LRDLAGLIVIDYIDMDEKRNNRTVERRLKEALKHDRARIQVGHISHFGLLEMSRQRIRSSVLESSTEKCPHCGGTGHVRSVSSVALQLLRAIEEMLLKGATHNLIVRTRTETALYLLNHKRAHLRELEERFQLIITVNADATIAGQVSYVIEKGEQVHSVEQAKALVAVQPTSIAPVGDDEDDEVTEEVEEAGDAGEIGEVRELGEEDHEAGGVLTAEAAPSDGEHNGRKRRRRRRGRRGGEGREGEASAPENGAGPIAAQSDEPPARADAEAETEFSGPEVPGESQADGEKRRRRRGRRGGRRSRHGREGEALPQSSDSVPPFQAEASMPEPHQGEPEEREPEQREPDQRGSYPRDYAEPSVEQRQAEVAQNPDQDRPFAEPAAEPIAPVPPVSRPAAPRRGSTVREPAPTSFSFGGEFSAPAPAAVVEPEQPAPPSGTESEDTTRPRRAGWWSKRVLGKG
jgi:ribonuclease E